MKKLALVLVLGVALVGCEIQKSDIHHVSGGNIRIFEFEGHEYLSFDGNSYNGGICHAESCPCKSK